jgi:hypothetical protein
MAKDFFDDFNTKVVGACHSHLLRWMRFAGPSPVGGGAAGGG